MDNLQDRIEEKINLGVKLVVFDLGGVVFNFSKGLDVVSDLLSADLNEITSYWLSCDNDICTGKLDPQRFWENLSSRYNFKDEINFIDLWMDNFSSITSTHKTIKKLNSENVEIGLLTNIYPKVFDQLIKRNIIPNIRYSPIIQSCDIGLVKPDSKIFKATEEATKYSGSEILFIDDGIKNINAAKDFGWEVIHFN